MAALPGLRYSPFTALAGGFYIEIMADSPPLIHHYILDEDGNPKQETDLMTWGKWFALTDRKVAPECTFTSSGGEPVRVSTVFLGIDHSYSEGHVELFETMIFGGEHDRYQEQYATRGEAIAGHDKAAEMVANSIFGNVRPLLPKPQPNFDKPQRSITLEDE